MQHVLQRLAVATWPIEHLTNDAQRVSGAVGLHDVARELLVRDVRVVLERSHGLHLVHVPALTCTPLGQTLLTRATPVLENQRHRQLSSPDSGVQQRSEVDGVHHPTRVEAGEPPRHQLIPGLQSCAGAVEERPAHA